MQWRYNFILVLAALSACTNKRTEDLTLTTPQVSIDLDSIKKRGYLTALVDNNSISYFLYKGQAMGYDYELLTRFAKKNNVRLKLKLVSGVENAIKRLNKGEGDILAFPLTITEQRKQYVLFTKPQFNSHQVLVQRKPLGWENMRHTEIVDSLIREPKQLAGKDVYVIRHSSFVSHLQGLSKQIGAPINIIEDSAEAESESLIERVARGEIQFTVADQVIADVNRSYYPNLDASTILSAPQPIAWAVRKNSPSLQQTVDEWLTGIKKESTFSVIYKRYYKSPRSSLLRATSRYASINGDRLSPYDDIVKKEAAYLGWDWRFLAAIVYEESRFINKEESWAGARGLMQLMPATAQRFGASDPDDPQQNIRAGVRFLKHLNEYWEKNVADTTERLKFILASYNVGLTHITDARKLTIKYKQSPNEWQSVQYYLMKKSDPKFYRAPEVMAGYCRCVEPVNYVEDVLARFEEYKMHIQ
jgi:membrane-bound lytic murein transglycosylase F